MSDYVQNTGQNNGKPEEAGWAQESGPLQDTGVVAVSDRLLEIRLAVAICGGIGAVEVVKIIREFRRHGACVSAYMTIDAERFITPLSVEWATQGRLVRAISAKVEHLEEFDWVVVVPATFNTLAKAAVGICDNPVTLLISNQIARRGNIVFVPTMNQSMAEHPVLSVHRETLVKWGAIFLESALKEGRLKVPEPERLVNFVIQKLEGIKFKK